MSDLGSSHSSLVMAEGVKMLAKEQEENSPSSSRIEMERGDSPFEADHSEAREDSNGVFTWIKPIKDAWAHEFWEKYSFP